MHARNLNTSFHIKLYKTAYPLVNLVSSLLLYNPRSCSDLDSKAVSMFAELTDTQFFRAQSLQ